VSMSSPSAPDRIDHNSPVSAYPWRATPRFRTTIDADPPLPPVTTWPAIPVPPLPVKHLPVSLDEGWLFYDGDDPEARDLPDELILRRLVTLDPSDRNAVVEFLNNFGFIGRPYRPDELAPNDLQVASVGDPPAGSAGHVRHAAAYLATARALTQHWIADREDRDVAQPWLTERFLLPRGQAGYAWHYFEKCLNFGLAAYRVRFQYMGRTPHPDLYEGLCLQLMNLIIEQHPIRLCANDTCTQYFTRHQGRAEHGQYRTAGIKYCCTSCARAQTERRRRRRLQQRNPQQSAKAKE
jgi:hypothetical protein